MSNLRKKYNLKSPAVKRLMREAAELNEPTEQYFAQPLEDNLFEWHFTVRGPPDTEFANGRYHGRITLPPEYPMKPPSIILLTPNGRFELGKKICLSMSAHHPETWQPSWSIRTVLLALIGFMPTQGGGAIGALDYTAEERKKLAERSMNWKCDVCGLDHSNCLLQVDPEHQSTEINEARELAAQISFKGETEKAKTAESSNSSNNSTAKSTADTTQNPVGHSTMEQQAAFNYTSQFNAMQNQSMMQTGGQSYLNSNDSRTNIPTTNNQSALTPPATEQNVRHRGNISQDVQPPQPAASNFNTPNVQANTQHSTFDNITLGLMWIITAILLVLIIRRLAMDGASLAKT